MTISLSTSAPRRILDTGSPTQISVAGVQILGAPLGASAQVLTNDALAFVAGLHRQFNPRRIELLAARVKRASDLDRGVLPDFLPVTEGVCQAEWQVAPAPADLEDRRVEI